MENNLKTRTLNFLRSFTPYQITYLVVVFALTIGFTIVMPDMMLEDMSYTFVVVF